MQRGLCTWIFFCKCVQRPLCMFTKMFFLFFNHFRFSIFRIYVYIFSFYRRFGAGVTPAVRGSWYFFWSVFTWIVYFLFISFLFFFPYSFALVEGGNVLLQRHANFPATCNGVQVRISDPARVLWLKKKAENPVAGTSTETRNGVHLCSGRLRLLFQVFLHINHKSLSFWPAATFA